MANAKPGGAGESGKIAASTGDHAHFHAHPHAGHDHGAERTAHGAAAMRRYRHSMFLASAIERLVIAVLLICLMWLGIFWAIS